MAKLSQPSEYKYFIYVRNSQPIPSWKLKHHKDFKKVFYISKVWTSSSMTFLFLVAWNAFYKYHIKTLLTPIYITNEVSLKSWNLGNIIVSTTDWVPNPTESFNKMSNFYKIFSKFRSSRTYNTSIFTFFPDEDIEKLKTIRCWAELWSIERVVRKSQKIWIS